MKSSTSSKLESHLTLLNKAQSELVKLVQIAESRLKAFQNVTKECIQYITKYQQKFCQRYLKVWFRSYLGIKDECMILINGEIVRPYHIPIHQNFTHKREKEAHYYNNKCTLSSCSVDGLDYEYRMLTDRFGNKSVIYFIFLMFDLLCEVARQNCR